MATLLSRRGWDLLNVRRGEEQALGLLFLTNFFIKASSLTLQTAGFALFLDRFGSEGLGALFIATAIITPLPAFVYLWLSRRLSIKQFLIGNYAFVLLGTGISYLGILFVQADWLLFALPIWLEIHMSFTILAIWTTAGYLFDVRQSKRLLGLVDSGAWLSTILVGFAIPPIVLIVGTNGLVGLSTLTMGISLFLIILITRFNSEKLTGQITDDEPEEPPTQTNVSKSIKLNSYAILIMGLVLAYWIGFNLTDFVFLSSAEQFFTDSGQLASVMALRVAIGGILGLVISTFFTSTVLRRFGLRTGLLILPVTLMILFSLIALVSNIGGSLGMIFLLGGASKVINQGIGRSIDKTSQVVLFQPLTDSVRVKIQTWAEAIIQPVAIGFGGVMLLILVNILGFGIRELSIAFMVVGVAWIMMAVRLARQYPDMLLKALQSRRLSFESDDPLDDASIAIIDNGLQSPHPEAVMYAIHLLEQREVPELEQKLRNLLHHNSPDVRYFAVNRLRDLKDTDSIEAIRQLVRDDPAELVKSAAIGTLLALGTVDVFNEVLFYLEDPDETIKQGALIALLQSGGIDGILAAGGHLNSLRTSTERRDRIIAAKILGEVGLELFYQPLVPLLLDTDVRVRHASLIAASKIKNPLLWSYCIEALSDPATRSIARTALANGGPSVIPEIAITLRNNPPQQVFMDLLIICDRIGTSAVTSLLKDKIDLSDSSLRSLVLRILRQTAYRADNEKRDAIYEQIERESEIATVLIMTSRPMEDHPLDQVIVDALKQSITSAQERLLDLLSFVEDRKIILAAQQAFRTGTTDRQSYALELLDNVLPRNLKVYMLPIFDTKHIESLIAGLTSTFPQQELSKTEYIIKMIQNSENIYTQWVQACALYVAGCAKDVHYLDAIDQATRSDERLIRTTAEWAKTQITQPSSGGAEMIFSLVEKVLILKTVGIFSEVPSEILLEVAGYLQVVDIAAGEYVFHKGDYGDSMYIIISGRVDVRDGDKLLTSLDARSVFGELALLDNAPRLASVTTVEDTRFFKLEKEIFEQLMETQVGLAHGVINVLMRYLREAKSATETLEVPAVSGASKE